MTKTVGYLAVQPLSAAEIGEIVSRPTLDVGDFCRITESEITSDHDRAEADYIISQEGVRYRPVSDHLLAMLFPDERDEILEQMRHALSFPCTPAEIVAFVKATDHCFTLPDGFAEAVTVIPECKPNEKPDERRMRFAKMRNAGMTGAAIAKIEGISVSLANTLAREGEVLLAKKAAAASTMSGQLGIKGVAAKKTKPKSA